LLTGQELVGTFKEAVVVRETTTIAVSVRVPVDTVVATDVTTADSVKDRVVVAIATELELEVDRLILTTAAG
jgi:hypothetical protein